VDEGFSARIEKCAIAGGSSLRAAMRGWRLASRSAPDAMAGLVGAIDALLGDRPRPAQGQSPAVVAARRGADPSLPLPLDAINVGQSDDDHSICLAEAGTASLMFLAVPPLFGAGWSDDADVERRIILGPV
jgi:hypothetical protein